MENNNQFNINGIDLILYAWKKKKILVGVSVIAFIASIIISFLITPMFKSKVVLFPAAQVSVAKSLLAENEKRDILTFGEEEEAERILQILNSDFIRGIVIERHNLMAHYEIDSATSKYPQTELYETYISNIKASRTQYMAIEIEVLDRDPEMAAAIANDIAGLIDSVVHVMQYERAYKAFKLVEKEYQKTQREITAINDSMRVLGELGVIDYETQAEGLNVAYAEALSKNDTKAIDRLKKERNALAKYGGNYLSMAYLLEYKTDYLNTVQASYAQAKISMESKLSQVFIIDWAYAAEKKAKPKKSIIVMASTFSAFALSLLLLLLVDTIKKRV